MWDAWAAYDPWPTATSSRRSTRRTTSGRARGGDQLRGVPDPPLHRYSLAAGLRADLCRARRDDGDALLPDRLRDHGRRLAGRARQSHRRRRDRVRPHGRLERAAALRDPDYRPANGPLVVKSRATRCETRAAGSRSRSTSSWPRTGCPIPGKVQRFVGSDWGHVRGFALPRCARRDADRPRRRAELTASRAFSAAAVEVIALQQPARRERRRDDRHQPRARSATTRSARTTATGTRQTPRPASPTRRTRSRAATSGAS